VAPLAFVDHVRNILVNENNVIRRGASAHPLAVYRVFPDATGGSIEWRPYDSADPCDDILLTNVLCDRPLPLHAMAARASNSKLH